MREARRQRRLANVDVPPICIFDPDGDIVRHLRQTGEARPFADPDARLASRPPRAARLSRLRLIRFRRSETVPLCVLISPWWTYVSAPLTEAVSMLPLWGRDWVMMVTLADHGFGVLTEIDVKKTLKSKLGLDVDDYMILGACNPKMAYEALRLEPKVGAMLPCNVIVRATQGGVDVSVIDPVASMAAIDNPELKRLAGSVQAMLRDVVAKL